MGAQVLMMGVWTMTAALQLVPKVELKWMIVMALQTAAIVCIIIFVF